MLEKPSKAKRPKLVQIESGDSLEVIISKSDVVTVGEWCFFRFDHVTRTNISLPDSAFIKNMLIGSAMGFRFSIGGTEKDKQYHNDTVPIETENIEVLATWYMIDESGDLISLGTNSNFFVDLKNYVASTTTPSFDKSKQTLSISADVVQLKQFLEHCELPGEGQCLSNSFQSSGSQ